MTRAPGHLGELRAFKPDQLEAQQQTTGERTRRLPHERRRGHNLHERGERRVLFRLDEIDDAQQQELASTQLEHVTDLDRRRDVRHAEVVALHVVNANGDSDHAGIVTPEEGGG